MNFRYSGYDRSGRGVQGSLEAPGLEEAREKLARQGVFITRLSEGAGAGGCDEARTPMNAPWVAHKRLGQLAEFARQLSVLVATGTPLVQALGAVERQAGDPEWGRIVRGLRESVEQGASLADAMGDNPRDFDAVTRSLIAAGESSGNMSEMLKRLSGITRQRQKTISTILGAMVYPVLLIFVSIIVIVVMLVFVVPRFAGMFDSLDTPLPATTRFLLDLGELIRGRWYFIVPGVLGVLGGVVAIPLTARGRRFIDSASIALPVLGKVVRNLALARIARMLGVLLVSHVKMLEALELTRQACANGLYRRLLTDSSDRVLAGDTLASVLASSPLVSPSFAETVRNGEQTGRLGEALSAMAEFMDEDNEIAVKSMTSLIEPAILIVLGLVVGFVALSLFLPLFDLTASAGRPR